MHGFHRHLSLIAAAALVAGGLAAPAQAADWSDTSLGIRGGSKYAEPFNGKDITKTIVNLNHASGYKYGSNFFNADFLLSDKIDPAGKGSTNGAQEVYVVYRHTLDLEKVTGTAFKFGPVRGLGSFSLAHGPPQAGAAAGHRLTARAARVVWRHPDALRDHRNRGARVHRIG